MADEIKIKMKNIYLFLIIVLIVGVGAYFVFNNDGGNDGQVIAPEIGNVEAQKVVLSQNGYNYKDAYAEAGKPIQISADSSVRGCLRSVSFNLEGKRYTKYLQTPSESLTLPSLKPGTYNYACSMGMGLGKLIIE